jgi:hypothetical protein
VKSRDTDLDRFYRILADLEDRCAGTRQLAGSHGHMSWPHRGVYFFFEPGEVRADGITPRVVRVGTHGLRPSRSTLWGRLSQHKGTGAGVMPGGGNHRGSIFRFHVGTALLASGAWPPEIYHSWGTGGTAPAAVRRVEYPLERAVTEHIGTMPFLWLNVDDPPSVDSDRGVIEAGAIALLSNLDRPACDPPTLSWLGRRARHSSVRGSGLWNVNHVRESHNPDFLDLMARYTRHHPVPGN